MGRPGLGALGVGTRWLAGPLVLAGFFLPWGHGPGVLAANEFSGFKLVGFAGHLQQLDLGFATGSGLWLARVALLAIPVTATWLTVLAPRHSRHPAYRLSGWYVVAFTAFALGIGAVRDGVVIPPTGLALLAVGAVLFVASEAASTLAHSRQPVADAQ